ncbi:Uncharacterised protein [Legionella busanensis]|uniref:Uncharacterized protein n=1 Tax=Legionella busanensis TaxID=190655 RepID=A0A378JQV1_9GAMM|nr:hypothetical protein [Legionella busanensis]STX52559.1 Uncharacterised protein [Legionella busanensis]
MPYNKFAFKPTAPVSEQANSLQETSSPSGRERIEQENSVPPNLNPIDFGEVLAKFQSASVPDPKDALNALKTNQQQTKNVPASAQSSSTQDPLFNPAPPIMPATKTSTNAFLYKKERLFYAGCEITDPNILSSVKSVGEGIKKHLVAMINGKEETIYKYSQKARHTLFLDGQEVTDTELYKKLWAIKCLAPSQHYHFIDSVGHYLLSQNQHKYKSEIIKDQIYLDFCKNRKGSSDRPSSQPRIGVASVAMFAQVIKNESEDEGNKKQKTSHYFKS